MLLFLVLVCLECAGYLVLRRFFTQFYAGESGYTYRINALRRTRNGFILLIPLTAVIVLLRLGYVLLLLYLMIAIILVLLEIIVRIVRQKSTE